MGSKKQFIQGAIKHPGALRETVSRDFGKSGFIQGGTIKSDILSELAGRPGVTGERARFAETLRGLRRRR